MKTVLGITMVLVAALAVGGCSKSHSDVMDDMASEMNSLADVLSKIKDGASAKAAAGDLEDIAENMRELAKVAESIGDPTEEEAEKLMEKGEAYGKAMQRVMTEMMRVQSIPEAREILDKIDLPGN